MIIIKAAQGIYVDRPFYFARGRHPYFSS